MHRWTLCCWSCKQNELCLLSCVPCVVAVAPSLTVFTKLLTCVWITYQVSSFPQSFSWQAMFFCSMSSLVKVTLTWHAVVLSHVRCLCKFCHFKTQVFSGITLLRACCVLFVFISTFQLTTLIQQLELCNNNRGPAPRNCWGAKLDEMQFST